MGNSLCCRGHGHGNGHGGAEEGTPRSEAEVTQLLEAPAGPEPGRTAPALPLEAQPQPQAAEAQAAEPEPELEQQLMQPEQQLIEPEPSLEQQSATAATEADRERQQQPHRRVPRQRCRSSPTARRPSPEPVPAENPDSAALAARAQAEGLVALAVHGHPVAAYNAVFRRNKQPVDGWPQYVHNLSDGHSLYLFRHAASGRWVMSNTYLPQTDEEDLERRATILAPEGSVPLGEHSWHRAGQDLNLAMTALSTEAETDEFRAGQEATRLAEWQERQKRLPELMEVYRKWYIPEKEKEDEATEAEHRKQQEKEIRDKKFDCKVNGSDKKRRLQISAMDIMVFDRDDKPISNWLFRHIEDSTHNEKKNAIFLKLTNGKEITIQMMAADDAADSHTAIQASIRRMKEEQQHQARGSQDDGSHDDGAKVTYASTYERAAAITKASGQHGDSTGISLAGIEYALEHELANTEKITAATTTSDLFKAHVLPATTPEGWTESWPELTNAAKGWYTHHYIEDKTGKERFKANGKDPDPPPGTFSLCAKLAANPQTAHFIGKPTHFVVSTHAICSCASDL
eukprot:COSAG02_NODE_7519_length_2975_cov_537.217316_1_plen_571_part_00